MRGKVRKAAELQVGVAVVLEVGERGLAGKHVEQVGEHHPLLRVRRRHRAAQVCLRTERDRLQRPAGPGRNDLARFAERDMVPGKRELSRGTAIKGDAGGHARGVLDAGHIDRTVAIAEEADDPLLEVDGAHAGHEQFHEAALEDVDLLEADRGDPFVRGAAPIKRGVFARGRLEQVEPEIRRQYAAHAVALARLSERHLAIDDDVRPALDRGHDDIDALGRTVERGRVGQIAFGNLGSLCGRQIQCLLFAGDVANQQANTGIGLFEQMMGDAAAEHSCGSGEQDGLGHS